MSTSSNNILEKTKAFVTDWYDNIPKKYTYHNFDHTKSVVDESLEIASGLNLDKNELEVLEIAGWFHDTGFVKTENDHENSGKSIAEKFLIENNYPEEKIQKVGSLILATKMPQSPKNLTEEILCDADLSNVGKKEFFKKSRSLRKEKELVNGLQVSDKEWIETEIEFLTKHKYHTDFAVGRYEIRKQKNINKLIAQLDNLNNPKESTEKNKKKKEVKPKPERPLKGIETMFRLAMRNHINLSAIADNKANIMLSISTLMLTIVASVLIPAIQNNFNLAVPTIMLVLVCIATIIFATLSTRPKITEGKFKQEDIVNKRANLIFFGNFYNMKLEDYEDGMREMMKDEEFLYGSMIRDLYFLGKVLAKKYRYLRICYNVFMYGLVIAIMVFIATIFITA